MTLALYGKSRRRQLGLLIFALLSVLAAVAVGTTDRLGVHAAPFSSADQDGANDEPGQKDLTWLSFNDAGLPTSIAVEWNWDIVGLTGNNSADGCALFDADSDLFVDFSICEVWKGTPPSEVETRLYTCGDTKGDRCTQPATEVTSFTSTCDVAVTNDDPFPAGDSYPQDTKATCTIDLVDVGFPTGRLLNVCSYPSQEPNSDPSDCVLRGPITVGLTITTQVNSSAILLGQSVTDGATLDASSGSATGDVDFFICDPGEVTARGCETGGTFVSTEIAGGNNPITVTSDAFTPDEVGKWCFRAEYTPDATAATAGFVSDSHTNATTECVTVEAPLAATVTIIKKIDVDGNLATTGDQSNGAGWNFNASITNGGTLGGSNPRTTAANGQVVVDVTPDADGSTVAIDEQLTSGYNFLGATCLDGTAPVGTLNSGTQTVSGIPVANGDAIVCTFYNQLQVRGPLNVTKTAEGLYDHAVDWTITKTATPTVLNLPDDGAGSVDYDIVVTRVDTPTNYRVQGTVTVMNPAGNTEDAIVASIVDANAVFSGCTPLQGSTPSYATAGQVTFTPALVLEPGESITCNYGITGLASGSLTLNEANATVTQASLVQPPAQNAQAAIVYAHSGVYTGEPTTINVTDIGDASGTKNFGPTSTTKTFEYSQRMTCVGAEYDATGKDTLTKNNRADIDETTDFAEETVTVNCQQPKLTVKKVVDGGNAVPADWTMGIVGKGSAAGTHSAFVPGGSAQEVTESTGPLGYTLTSLVCTDSNGKDVPVDDGELTMPPSVNGSVVDVECVFTNTFDPASIKVTKVVDWAGTINHPANPTFTICVYGPNDPALLVECKNTTGGDVTFGDLLPGSYVVRENDPGVNWTVTGNNADVTLETGEDATRTVTNTFRPGALVVQKNVVLGGATLPANSSFKICITGPSYPLGETSSPNACQVLTNAGPLTWNNLLPGQYTVAETSQLLAGYWETPVISGSPVTVAAGSVASPTNPNATVTNTLKKASIAVTKTVNWNGYTPGPNDNPMFEVCITGPSFPSGDCKTVGAGQTATWTNLIPGVYTVSETNPGSEWTVVVDGDGDTALVTLDPGEQGSAGVTNTLKRGTLTIRKDVVWNGPADPAKTFEICITGPSYPNGNEAGACNTFSEDESYTWTNLIKGTYTVDETDPGSEWMVTGEVDYNVPAGSGVGGAVTNTRVTGDLTVGKTVDWSGAPADPNQVFEICIKGPSYPLGNEKGACQQVDFDGGSVSWSNLQTGTYTVTETFPGGDGAEWDTTVDGTPGTSGDVGVVTGESSTVDIVNTLKGVTLTIKKVYVGEHAPQAPTIVVDGNAVTGGPDTWGPLDDSTTPAIHPNTAIEVAEILPAGWLNTDVTYEGQCGEPGILTLVRLMEIVEEILGAGITRNGAGLTDVIIPPGTDCTVTFTNTWSPAKIVVNKTVDWAGTVNHPANPDFEICLFAAGADSSDPSKALECGSTDGSTPVTFDELVPGDYVVAETNPGSSWSTTVDAQPGLSVDLTLVENDEKTVQVVNTFRPGALQATKLVELGGAPPVPGVFAICVVGPSYPAPDCQLAAHQATVIWAGLLPGIYQVSELPAGPFWEAPVIQPGSVEVEAGETAQSNAVTVTNTLEKGRVIVHKIYVGATATNADRPLVKVGDVSPAAGNVVNNANDWAPVDVTPYVPVNVSEELVPGWKAIDVAYGPGCLAREIDVDERLFDVVSEIVGIVPLGRDQAIGMVEPGGTCEITFTNVAYGTVIVEKVDASQNGEEWDFSVTGPEFNKTPHISGSGSVTYVEVPLGQYSAAETNPEVLPSIGACPLPNPNGDGVYMTALTSTTQQLAQPGQTITFRFRNEDCPVVLGTGTLVVEKHLDLDGTPAPGDPLLQWTVTVQGPEFPGGQQFVMNGTGSSPVAGRLVLPGIKTGEYTVTESSVSGYTQTGLIVNGVTLAVSTTTKVEVEFNQIDEVKFYNQPLGSIRVDKVTLEAGTPVDERGGWQITVTGCGITRSGTTNANGVIIFNNLPACPGGYTVTENGNSKPGFVATTGTTRRVDVEIGETTEVQFINERTCTTNCGTVTPTPPTPTPTTPAPTNTPTSTPTNTPTPVDTVAGEITPGAKATPIAPNTGVGLYGSSSSATFAVVILGLLAVSGGATILAIARRR